MRHLDLGRKVIRLVAIFTFLSSALCSLAAHDVAANSHSKPAQNNNPSTPTRTPSETCDLPDLQVRDTCQSGNCGGNSPFVNRFPINGLKILDSRQCNNAQGVHLKGGIYSLKPNCNGKFLNVNNNELTAGDCKGQDLDGAIFQLEHCTGDCQKDPTFILEIEIITYGTKSLNNTAIPVYLFRVPGGSKSLCDLEESFSAQERLHILKNQTPSAGGHLARTSRSFPLPEDDRLVPESDLAIVFASEVHGKDDAAIMNSQVGWFNIACTRDALAKLDLDQIEPHRTADAGNTVYQKHRTAALKMVTANYCVGAGPEPKHDHPYTYEGNDIEIDFKDYSDNWRSNGQNSPFIEAIWDESGALCLENTRLMKSTSRTSIPWELLPADCNQGGCYGDEDLISKILEECAARRTQLHLDGSLQLYKKCSDVPSTKGYFRTHPH